MDNETIYVHNNQDAGDLTNGSAKMRTGEKLVEIVDERLLPLIPSDMRMMTPEQVIEEYGDQLPADSRKALEQLKEKNRQRFLEQAEAYRQVAMAPMQRLDTSRSYSHFVMNVLKAGSAAGVTKQEELNKMADILWGIYGPYLMNQYGTGD